MNTLSRLEKSGFFVLADLIRSGKTGDFKPSKQLIKKAKESLSKKHKVKRKYLKYLNAWEMPELKRDPVHIVLLFNIIDPKHKNYKTTIGYDVPKRGKR